MGRLAFSESWATGRCSSNYPSVTTVHSPASGGPSFVGFQPLFTLKTHNVSTSRPSFSTLAPLAAGACCYPISPHSRHRRVRHPSGGWLKRAQRNVFVPCAPHAAWILHGWCLTRNANACCLIIEAWRALHQPRNPCDESRPEIRVSAYEEMSLC